jgi:hypothetical protein
MSDSRHAFARSGEDAATYGDEVVMTGPRASVRQFRALSPGPLCRLGASLALAIVVAIPCVIALEAGAAAGPGPAATVSRPVSEGHTRPPGVTRTAGAVPMLVTARPIRHRALGLDAAMLVAILVSFGLFGRRENVDSDDRFRFDALFAHRRGPPSLLHSC